MSLPDGGLKAFDLIKLVWNEQGFAKKMLLRTSFLFMVMVQGCNVSLLISGYQHHAYNAYHYLSCQG